MAFRRAIGAVKDQTSISLAKVNNYSDSLSDLEIAIVKATRHEEYPAEERHVREILSLTHYSRHLVSACVSTIARRLSKTRNWVVALKSLMLIQRLLEEGEGAYQEEVFFATRRGTRLLNLSDFRDTTGRHKAWDYSAFVRTFALYLDERLEYRMQGRRKSTDGGHGYGYEHRHYYGRRDEEEEAAALVDHGGGSEEKGKQKEVNVEQLMTKMLQLQQLLDRFLATRPAGVAKSNRVVLVALYPVVKDSFHTYYDITDILGLLIHKFIEVDIPDAVNIHDIFCRCSKQFDELESYYTWSKEVGITRFSECPQIERISPDQLQQMEDFISQKSANSQLEARTLDPPPPPVQEDEPQEDPNAIKALPAPPEEPEREEMAVEHVEKKTQEEPQQQQQQQHEGDLLNLRDERMTSEQYDQELSLVLFDEPGSMGPGSGPGPSPSSGSAWNAFKSTNSSDWETELVQSSSYLPQQKAQLGGGLDMLVLDGLYRQGSGPVPGLAPGSASSVAYGSAGNPPLPMLALPAPPGPQYERNGSCSGPVKVAPIDPFGPSTAVPPPSYVQMSELEKKQRLMMEEQMMWQQYGRNGMSVPQGQYMGGYSPYQSGYRYY